jgi:hypothetical protein
MSLYQIWSIYRKNWTPETLATMALNFSTGSWVGVIFANHHRLRDSRAPFPVVLVRTPVTRGQSDAESYSRVISPVQNFRFSTPTDYANGSTSSNFGVRNDAVRYQEEEDGKEAEETDDEEVGTEVGEEPYEQLIRRFQIASQSLEQLHFASRGGEERGSGLVFPPGDCHHFYTSPSQDVSGVVPQRFHQGRESSSVLQNITVRESKRSKARSLHRDYQRRVSFTPSAALHSLGAGVFNGVTRREGGSDGTSCRNITKYR